MEEKNKLKAYTKIICKRYPFIKDINIEDDSYSNTLFLIAKIDANELGEFLGAKVKKIFLTVTTALSIFFEDEEFKERANKLSRRINADLSDLNKILPEEFRLEKLPNILSFEKIDSPTF